MKITHNNIKEISLIIFIDGEYGEYGEYGEHG
jgi:hypothetical protein